MLVPQGPRLGNIQLLCGTGDSEVLSAGQVPAARAQARRVVVNGLVRDFPAHRCPGRSGLLAPVPLLSSRPRLLLRRLAARHAITGGRHRAVAAVTRQHLLQPHDLLPQHRDLIRLRPYRIPQLTREFLQLSDSPVPRVAPGAAIAGRRKDGHGT